MSFSRPAQDNTANLIIKVNNLPANHRLIIVGDIHRCLEEFNELLDKCRFVPSQDTVCFVGDLVNKGPDSIGVVRRCMEIGAVGVLGNHDWSLLRCIRRLEENPEDFSAKDVVHRLARDFPSDCRQYLENLPHVIEFPAHNLVVLHAGIHPDRSLTRQRLFDILHCRTLIERENKPGLVCSDKMKGILWAKQWNGPRVVVFGHNARTGLQVMPFAFGIDTGCCYGESLTALESSAKKTSLLSVSSRQMKPSLKRRESSSGLADVSGLPAQHAIEMETTVALLNHFGVAQSSDNTEGLDAVLRQTLRLLVEKQHLEAIAVLLDGIPFYERVWPSVLDTSKQSVDLWVASVRRAVVSLINGTANAKVSLVHVVYDIVEELPEVRQACKEALNTLCKHLASLGRSSTDAQAHALQMLLQQ